MKELTWQQRLLRFSVCLLLAGILWFIPVSEDLPIKGWHIFSVFIAVIASFILRPYPIGAMVLFGLVGLMATRTITIEEALSGYGNKTVWLVGGCFSDCGECCSDGIRSAIGARVGQSLGEISFGVGILALRCGVVAGGQ